MNTMLNVVIRYDLNGTYSSEIFVREMDKRYAELDPSTPLFTFNQFTGLSRRLKKTLQSTSTFRIKTG